VTRDAAPRSESGPKGDGAGEAVGGDDHDAGLAFKTEQLSVFPTCLSHITTALRPACATTVCVCLWLKCLFCYFLGPQSVGAHGIQIYGLWGFASLTDLFCGLIYLVVLAHFQHFCFASFLQPFLVALVFPFNPCELSHAQIISVDQYAPYPTAIPMPD